MIFIYKSTFLTLSLLFSTCTNYCIAMEENLFPDNQPNKTFTWYQLSSKSESNDERAKNVYYYIGEYGGELTKKLKSEDLLSLSSMKIIPQMLDRSLFELENPLKEKVAKAVKKTLYFAVHKKLPDHPLDSTVDDLAKTFNIEKPLFTSSKERKKWVLEKGLEGTKKLKITEEEKLKIEQDLNLEKQQSQKVSTLENDKKQLEQEKLKLEQDLNLEKQQSQKVSTLENDKKQLEQEKLKIEQELNLEKQQSQQKGFTQKLEISKTLNELQSVLLKELQKASNDLQNKI
jgi:hypothetical protein